MPKPGEVFRIKLLRYLLVIMVELPRLSYISLIVVYCVSFVIECFKTVGSLSFNSALVFSTSTLF